MNWFTIKDIENLTSIKAHTWRMWEVRHNIGIPQRKDSNHRMYDNESLKKILKISYLYHAGYKISSIAAMDNNEISRLTLNKEIYQSESEFLITEMLEAAIDLDEDRFLHAFEVGCKKMGLDNALLKVVYPFQKKIGVLWITEHVIPAQEHFTSNIIRQKICAYIEKLKGQQKLNNKAILLFTPENERHEIPLLLMHYLLKKHGIMVVNLGCNISLSEVEQFSNRTKNCTHVLFYLVTNLNHWEPQEYLEQLCSLLPTKQIVMAGKYAHEISQTPTNAILLKSVEDALEFCKEISN